MSGVYPSSPSERSSVSSPRSSSSSQGVRSVPGGRRPRGSSVHTAAAMDVVDASRRSLRTPAPRSVRYADSIDALRPQDYPSTAWPHSGRPLSARPGTAASAAALAGVVPTGGDRLKHLQLHMEQLQQLYAQEIHKEELSRREAFVQSMCTSSITLWRYVCSKPRFFTAVKALVTQYLPARDARLYEVEEVEGADDGDGGLALVMADGRVVAVHSPGDAIGIVGRAVVATSQLSAAQWTKIQRVVAQQVGADDASAGSPSRSSSLSSSARSSSTEDDEIAQSKPGWLDRHVDCVLPSANDHVLVLLPLDRVYRDSGFDPEIDLTIKKRDLFEGSTSKQLLLVVLRDANKRPLGAFEALVTTQKPIQVDFLDAFASLLAASLEARRSICRPTAGAGLSVGIVHDDEVNHANAQNTSSRKLSQTEQITLEIAPGVKMVVAGGAHSAENDLPLLEAVRKPMAELLSQQQQWQRRATFREDRRAADLTFWTSIVTTIQSIQDHESDHAFRSDVRDAINRLEDAAVWITVLFEGETMEDFISSQSAKAHKTPSLSMEGQFAALERAIRTGEMFSSTPLVTAVPVAVGELKAAVLALVETVDPDDEEFVESMKSRTLPLALKAVELALWTELGESERAASRVEAELLAEALQETESRVNESEAVLGFSHRLALCGSLEEIARYVCQFGEATQLETRLADATLFIAEYMDEGDTPDSQVHSVWTVCAKGGDRLIVYERDNVTSPRRRAPGEPTHRQHGGMATFVLESGAPLMFTQEHVAFDPILREKIRGRQQIREPSEASYFYAIPLCVPATSRVHGVLEFTFLTEEDQKAFAASALATSISATIEGFLELHHWVSTREKQLVREAANVKNANDCTWTRWRAFLSAMCSSTEIAIDSWKAAVESHASNLFPRASHVNVLVRGTVYGVNHPTSGQDELIEAIRHELQASERRESPSLNVHNNTVLWHVSTFSLGDLGLLVVAKESKAEASKDLPDLAIEVDTFGTIASHFLTNQLHHITMSRQVSEEAQRLRELLANVEKKLSTEQNARAIVTRATKQQSAALRVYVLLGELTCINSEDEVMTKIVESLVDGADEATPSLLVGVALPGNEDNGWIAWTSGSSTTHILSASVSRLLASYEVTNACDPPFPSSQVDLVRQLWPQEQLTTTCRLVVAPLETVSYGRSLAGRLVLFVPDGDRLESLVDISFAAKIAYAVDHVVARYSQIRHDQDMQDHLNQVTSKLEHAQKELEASNFSRERWVNVRQVVFDRLKTLGGMDAVEEAAKFGTVCEELVLAVQSHLQREIGAILRDDIDGGGSTVRIVVRQGEQASLVQEIVSEWVQPAEQPEFFARSRKHQRDDCTRVEFYGGVADKVLLCIWEFQVDKSSALVGVVGVRLSDHSTNIAASDTFEASVEDVMVDAMELVITAEEVLALHCRVHQGTSEIAKLTELLEARTSEIGRTLEDTARRQCVSEMVLKLLNNTGEHASLVSVINELPGLCLWIHEHNDRSMWTIQRDGAKTIQIYDPTTWKNSSHAIEIRADSLCEGLLVAVDESALRSDELRLVASVIQDAVDRRQLRQKLDDFLAQATIEADAAAQTAERNDTRRSEIVRHWHSVEKLFSSSASTSDTSGEDETWERTLAHVEESVSEDIPDVTAARLVFIDLDILRRCVVVSSSTHLSDAYHRIPSILDLWTMEDSAVPLIRVRSGRENADVATVLSLVTTSLSNASTAIFVALPVENKPHRSESLRSFSVLVALTELPVDGVSIDVSRALEIDLRLVVTAHERYQEHQATRRRAVEAEMALVALKEQVEQTQQWVAFMQSTQQDSQQLVRAAVEASVDVSSGNAWSTVAEQIEVFIKAVCGCEGVEMYDAVTDGEEGSKLLVPLMTRGATLSPSARSREFAKTLDRLANDPAASEQLMVEATASGSRVVTAIHDLRNERVVGVIVIHWSEAMAVSDTELEIVKTLVRSWLTTVFTIVHEAESQRITHDASTLQIQSLAREKRDLEMQGLEMKSLMTQIEQRNSSLQSTLQAASELMDQLRSLISSIGTIQEPRELWMSLASTLAVVGGVYGVQLYETTDAREPKMMLSTLSNAEDGIMFKALGSQDTPDIVRRCLQSQQPHELRVLFQSEYKRVRIVCQRGQDQSGDKCFVIIFASDKQISHQQLALVDQFVTICVALTAHRTAELDKMELQAAAASALETAAQDLMSQLKGAGAELERVHSKLRWRETVEGNLAQDLLAHDIWRPVEKTAQASTTMISTAKLTAMWKFLQATSQKRLQAGLDDVSLSVQLYGIVNATGAKRGFVFSLPSQPASTVERPAAKGFFCVALSQLEQRREWRKMLQCINSASQVPPGTLLCDGTTLFPVRSNRSAPAKKTSELALDENDSADEQEDETRGILVGVLLVKVKRTCENTPGIEITSLIQDLADAIAPRVEWIGCVVEKKQQNGNQTKPSQPAALNHEIHTENASHERGATMDNQEGQQFHTMVSQTKEYSDFVSGTSTGVNCSPYPSQEERRMLFTPTPDSRTAQSNSVTYNNQDEHDRTTNREEGADSDEEREAERIRSRIQVSVTAGVVDFVLRVQAVPVDEAGSFDALRRLVAREMKNVWCIHGDERKHLLGVCELFFSEGGVVSDSLDTTVPSTTSAPQWVSDFVSRSWDQATPSAGGFCIWKVDLTHWIVSQDTVSPSGSTRVLMTLTASASLSRVFDAIDEHRHLLSLVRAIASVTTHILRGLARQVAQREQKSSDDRAAAQRDADWQMQCDELQRRSKLEEQLSTVTATMLRANDERVVIQAALQTMQNLLRCEQVAFHASESKRDNIVSRPREGQEDALVVALETVIRVRVMDAVEDSGDRELLGTMIARLTDVERVRMDSCLPGDAKEWTMRFLQRLADATAIAISAVRQRLMLRQAETTLASASDGLQTQATELLSLENENKALQEQVSSLSAINQHYRDVERDNAALREQLEQLRNDVASGDQARVAMATQLKQYETQLVEVNCQLEQSIRAETQLMRLEETHAATQAREARLEKMALKHKLQLKQLVAELTARREKDERDQAELIELRRHVAVLTEKQHHSGGMDASSVATAVMQAQAQAMAQTQAIQQHHAQAELKQHAQQQRVHTALQRRMFRQLQLQQQAQKRKQLDLAQELQHLAALEVEEMTRRTTTSHGTSRKKSLRASELVEKSSIEVAKVHDVRSPILTGAHQTADDIATPSEAAPSRLRAPRIAVSETRRRQSVARTATAASVISAPSN